MSLLSPDTLSLYIEPNRIQAVKAVGLGQQAGEVRQRTATVHAADNWLGMTQVCTELLTNTQVKRLRVVLSDKLVRYACFPWRPELRNAEEELAMAQLQFDDVHGPGASADWHFALTAGRPGQSRLSVALPKALYTALQSQINVPGYRLLSVRTAFTATLQKHRKRLEETGWLVNLEQGRLTLGSWHNGDWRWIYSVHSDIDAPEALLARIRQEIQMSSTSLKAALPLSIYLHAPVMEHLPFGAIEGVRFVPLKTLHQGAGAKYAFALMGAKA